MKTISVTTAIKRLEKDWSIIAKEPVKVEVIDDVFYGFCSELGSLRIAVKFPNQLIKSTASYGYSENLESWFFCLELKISK